MLGVDPMKHAHSKLKRHSYNQDFIAPKSIACITPKEMILNVSRTNNKKNTRIY